ncbi:galactose-3-O-sulfotransferase-domain-containing protein [Cladochytrium replicatum]|nr:galactose-3-O-sulfotransferase-domain-containing protein [Cladochytrium replicatum]
MGSPKTKQLHLRFANAFTTKKTRLWKMAMLFSLVWLVFMPESSSTTDTTLQLTSDFPLLNPDPTFNAPEIRLTFQNSRKNPPAPPIPHSQTWPPQRYIFIKTHKTGSTTLGSIFFRYGVSHRLKIFIPGRHYADQMDFEPPKLTSNLASHIFLSHFGPMNRSWFREHPVQLNVAYMMQMYRRAVPGGMGITILRDPHARFLSHYQYLIRPSHPQLSLSDYARTRKVFSAPGVGSWSQNWNRQCQELGIRTVEDLNRFLAVEKDKYFALILVTELFDESLVLMRRMLGWEREDILYVKMLDSCADGHRWDNKAVECSKTFAKMVLTEPGYEETRDLVARANRLDMMLYKAVRIELEMKLAAQGADFWEEVRELKDKIKALKRQCASFSALNNPIQIKLVNWTQKVTSRNLIRLRNMAEKERGARGDDDTESGVIIESQVDHDTVGADLVKHQSDLEQDPVYNSPNDIGEEVYRFESTDVHPDSSDKHHPKNPVRPVDFSHTFQPLQLSSVRGEMDAPERNRELARALKMFAEKLALQTSEGLRNLNNNSAAVPPIMASLDGQPDASSVGAGIDSAINHKDFVENLGAGRDGHIIFENERVRAEKIMSSFEISSEEEDINSGTAAQVDRSAITEPEIVDNGRFKLKRRAASTDVEPSIESLDSSMPLEQQDSATRNRQLALTLQHFASRSTSKQDTPQQSKSSSETVQNDSLQIHIRSNYLEIIQDPAKDSDPQTNADKRQTHDPHLVERRQRVKLALAELSIFDGTAQTREEARNAFTVHGEKVDPYPCFPYTVSDLHYEKLIRLSRGKVTYVPGLVPTEEDEIWQSFT